MTFFYSHSRVTRPLVAVLGLAVTSLFAQTGVSTAPATTASASAAPPAFSSVFDSYQPYTEEKTANWQQANDNTARIGGWRAYAKEAAEPNPGVMPVPVLTPAKP